MAHTDQDLLAMWRDGNRIDAIKIFRNERNVTLVQAKDALEGLDQGTAHSYPVLPVGIGAMTLRDHFAGLAMSGAIDFTDEEDYVMSAASAEELATTAYLVADAMLKARSK